MQLYFFPRDRQFWLYHCSALAVGLAVTITITMVLRGNITWYELATSFAWMPLYTLVVLTFRWLYRRKAGETLAIGKVIVWAVLYSALAGAALAGLLQTLVLPFFWDSFATKFASAAVPVEYLDFLFSRMLQESPQNQLFVLAWSFIYISVIANRLVKKTELFNLRLQNNLKEAQLSSLSNQLNPHFLFNSLNNIRFMIHEDAQRADTMITSFSEILRYSLESSKCEKVCLGDEISIIRKYIAIVATQLEERLEFNMIIPDDLHEALVPPMVLQMLIENAIKHGLENMQAGGKLTLDAEQQGQKLVFNVSNDIPPALRPSAPAPGMGIGLRNISDRLALLYGDLASLDVNHADTRFSVKITLPLEAGSWTRSA